MIWTWDFWHILFAAGLALVAFVLLMKPKKSDRLLWGGLVAAGVGALVIFSLIPAPFSAGVQQPQAGGQTNNIVTSSTTLSLSAIDALDEGTATGQTNYTSVNGGPFVSGKTSVSQGDRLDIVFIGSSGYHGVYLPGLVVPAKTTYDVPVKLYANTSVSMTVFNTDNSKMTNGGGATNQSMSTGSSANMAIRMDGVDKKSSSDLRCVLEASDNTKVDKLSLSGFGAKYIGMTKPSSYTLAATTSQVWVYDIDPIVGATSPSGVISVISKSGQDASATYFKITCYSKEYFVDPLTGKVDYAIEDSEGTAKYLALSTFKGYFE